MASVFHFSVPRPHLEKETLAFFESVIIMSTQDLSDHDSNYNNNNNGEGSLVPSSLSPGLPEAYDLLRSRHAATTVATTNPDHHQSPLSLGKRPSSHELCRADAAEREQPVQPPQSIIVAVAKKIKTGRQHHVVEDTSDAAPETAASPDSELRVPMDVSAADDDAREEDEDEDRPPIKRSLAESEAEEGDDEEDPGEPEPEDGESLGSSKDEEDEEDEDGEEPNSEDKAFIAPDSSDGDEDNQEEKKEDADEEEEPQQDPPSGVDAELEEEDEAASAEVLLKSTAAPPATTTIVLRGPAQSAIRDGDTACMGICISTGMLWMTEIGIVAERITHLASHQQQQQQQQHALLRQWIETGATWWTVWKRQSAAAGSKDLYATASAMLVAKRYPAPYRDLSGYINQSRVDADVYPTLRAALERLEPGACAAVACAAGLKSVLVFRCPDEAGGGWWFFDSHGRDDDGVGEGGAGSYFLATLKFDRLMQHFYRLFSADVQYSASFFRAPDSPPTGPVYMRVASIGGKDHFYGSRKSIPADQVVSQLGQLSLLIPAFTLRKDIPSGKEAQDTAPWLSDYLHLRYVGLFDFDADFSQVKEGKEPLFQGELAVTYTYLKDVKKAFTERLKKAASAAEPPSTALMLRCPAFKKVLDLTNDLVKKLTELEVPCLAFYSGGGGCRVLVQHPSLWCRVRWGARYAEKIVSEFLPTRLLELLGDDHRHLVARVLKYTDPSIYDRDKGVKPDVGAHPETQIYPCLLPPVVIRTLKPDDLLIGRIREFWTWVVENIPDDRVRVRVLEANDPSTRTTPTITTTTTTNKASTGAVGSGSSSLLKKLGFKKVSTRREATHFDLKDQFTSYYRVDNPEKLRAGMASAFLRGERHFCNEIATAVRRFAIDYDGGPDLLKEVEITHDDADGTDDGAPARRASPLAVIQQFLRGEVVQPTVPDQDLHVLVAKSPPRQGAAPELDFAHLTWPGVIDPKEDHLRISHALISHLTAKFKHVGNFVWSKIIDLNTVKVGFSRMLTADKWSKDKGQPENRILRAEYTCDVHGAIVLRHQLQLQQQQGIVELLRLSSLRNDPGLEWENKLTPLTARICEMDISSLLSGDDDDHPQEEEFLQPALLEELEAWARANFDFLLPPPPPTGKSFRITSLKRHHYEDSKREYLYAWTTQRACPNHGAVPHKRASLYLQIDCLDATCRVRCSCKCTEGRERKCSEWRSARVKLSDELRDQLVVVPSVFAAFATEIEGEQVLEYLYDEQKGVAELFAGLYGTPKRLVYDAQEPGGQWYVWMGRRGWIRDRCNLTLHLVSRMSEIFKHQAHLLEKKAAAETAADDGANNDDDDDAESPEQQQPGEEEAEDVNTAEADKEGAGTPATNNKKKKKKNQQQQQKKKKSGPTLKALYELSKKLCTSSYCKGVLPFLQSYFNLEPSSAAQWDTDPMLLAVKNGVVDLRDGSFRLPHPDQRIRTIAPTVWRGLDVECPVWERFILDICDDVPELAEFRQRLLGYCITGETNEHYFVILYGQAGRNGKDTMMNVLKELLGDYVGPVSKEIVVERRSATTGAAAQHLVDLMGRRIGWVSEIKRGERLNSAQVKEISGGSRIKARPVYGRTYVEFQATVKLFIMANWKLAADSEDDAMWARMLLLEHVRSYLSKAKLDKDPEVNRRKKQYEADRRLLEKLLQEKSGILAWLVRGCIQYQESGGLEISKAVLTATRDYQNAEDWKIRFFDECCEDGDKEAADPLYQVYRRWSVESNGDRVPLPRQSWTQEMVKKWPHRHERTGNYFCGLVLKEEYHRYRRQQQQQQQLQKQTNNTFDE